MIWHDMTQTPYTEIKSSQTRIEDDDDGDGDGDGDGDE